MVKDLLNQSLNHKSFNHLLDGELSLQLYQLFLCLIGGDLSDFSLIHSLVDTSTVLALFEMALFSKQVLKFYKSHGIIAHRTKMISYLETYEHEIFDLHGKGSES